MNAPELNAKLTSDLGWPALRASSDWTAPRIAEDLYLRVYSRCPTEAEQQVVTDLLASAQDTPSRRAVLEDLLWALLNTPEFLFKD